MNLDDETIRKEIVKVLRSEGYGWTAAENSVSPITEIVFQHAFNLGFSEAKKQLTETKNSVN